MVQQVIVGLIVLIAVGFVVRRIVAAIASARSTKAGACGSGCGCAPASAPVHEHR